MPLVRLLGGAAVVLVIGAPHAIAQRASLAIGPGTSAAAGQWSGEAQCVLVSKGADYQEEQIHTWRLTGDPPKQEGAFQIWPAVWSVKGSGQRVVPVPLERSGATAAKPSERWTISAEMSAPLSIWELAGRAGQLRISARHGQLSAPIGSIQVTPTVGRPLTSAQAEWQFPMIEDVVTSTAVAGRSTRTLPEGVVLGWRQPRTVATVETCTWKFVRGTAPGTITTPTLSARSIVAKGFTARGSAGSVAPRAITMTGFTARGSSATVPPRTIVMRGFTAAGGAVSVPPRSITMPGFSARGGAVSVPPRAITMPGFSAAGANAPGRGGRRE
jgi:hypothetical protein